MTKKTTLLMPLAGLALAAGISCGDDGGSDITEIVENRLTLGDGHIASYVELDKNNVPLVIGVSIDQLAVDTLPTDRNDGQLCWDLDGNGTILKDSECGWGHGFTLWLPKLDKVPFTYMLFNWATFGHGPVHVFDKPHFDVHVYVNDNRERLAIRPGPCPSFINCEDKDRSLKPIPSNWMPAGFEFQVGGAAQGYMGNHIVDLDDPVHTGGELTQLFAYGTYDGHLTFWEPLVTAAFLKSKPNECQEIAQPAEFEKAGYYPLVFCTRYRADRKDYVITLEDFVYREAAPAKP